MRHCHAAVPIEKVYRGHMGRPVENKFQDKLPIKKYNTKTVSTSHSYNGVSTNWKLDVYRYKNYSYAQVVKGPTSRGPLATPNVATSGTSPTQGKCVQNNDMSQCKDKVNSYKSSKTHVVTTQSSPSYKHDSDVKGHTSNKAAYTVKVSLPKPDIKLTNRFHILQESDGVVSEPLGDTDQINDSCANSHTRVNKTTHGDAHSTCTPQYLKLAPHNNVKPSSHQVLGSHKPPEIDLEGQSYTKYNIDLRLKAKKSYKEFLPRCQTLQHWEAQTKFKFGFIPLGELKLPHTLSPKQTSFDPLQLHEKIKKSGKYNYLYSQFIVDSQLKPEVWDKLLQGYWDKQLPLFIRFGFPLDFDRRATLVSHLDNHSSAKAYPEDIKAYLQEETAYKANLGPYTQPPLAGLHRSPFMTRDKPDSPHRRVIIDLSFPHGNLVNAGIAKDIYSDTPFILKLPTIDNITNHIKSLGRGCKLYKVDISRAFRHFKLDPRDYDLLGLYHNWFLDTCLPFGYHHGSALFQRLSDAVHRIMRQRNYDVMNYIDDILGIDVPSKIDASFDALQHLLKDLGFEISTKKLVQPTTSMNCLGIIVDTIHFTLVIPDKKLAEILNMCDAWHQKMHCDKCQLQSFLGSLLYVTKCVRISRFFLNRLLEFLRSMEDKVKLHSLWKREETLTGFENSCPPSMGLSSLTKGQLTVQLSWMPVSGV